MKNVKVQNILKCCLATSNNPLTQKIVIPHIPSFRVIVGILSIHYEPSRSQSIIKHSNFYRLLKFTFETMILDSLLWVKKGQGSFQGCSFLHLTQLFVPFRYFVSRYKTLSFYHYRRPCQGLY